MPFAYHASAVGLGGVLNTGVIPSQASVALAPTGGEGHAVIDRYRGPGQVFADHAETHVTGSQRGSLFTTTAEVFITGLEVVGRLQVASMWAKITSQREVSSTDVVIDSVFHLEASIVGLSVNGDNVSPVLDVDLFSTHPMFDEFVQHVGNNSNRPGFRQRFGWAPDEDQAIGALCTEMAKMTSPAAAASAHPASRVLHPIRTSLLKEIHPELENSPRMRRFGYRLEVPRFGNVHLAEVLLKPGRRRINMLRLDLDPSVDFDCDPDDDTVSRMMVMMNSTTSDSTSSSGTLADSGTLSVASIEGNGAPTFP